MRAIHIVGATVFITVAASCSSELVKRPLAQDPTSVAASEAPFHPLPSFEPDPLSGVEPPTGRDKRVGEPRPAPLTVYTCPMHAAVERKARGECPICGMALVPKEQP